MTDEVSVTQVMRDCPFCGGEPYLIDLANTDWFKVKCLDCTNGTERYQRRESAIDAWNQRVTTPAEHTLLTLVNTMREYLPPDGISKEEFINRVIHLLDNEEINPVIEELEGRK